MNSLSTVTGLIFMNIMVECISFHINFNLQTLFMKKKHYLIIGLICLLGSFDAGNAQLSAAVLDHPRKSLISETEIKTLALKVTGTLTDAETGITLIGATVQVKGTTTGTSTDLDGTYSIEAPDGNAILVFSYIGYVNQEVVVGNQSTINVSLVPDIQSLNEVVVVGYGAVKKMDLTGAVDQLQSKDIIRANPVQAARAIQGQVAGATVTKSSNKPGAPYNISIRGENTINNSTQPLVVIDGLMGGDINSINPNDIQSMDVLKDASSTAIYGARGANGVIIITTKKGFSG
jgi:TonB-dependent SusC/RagA subfamily outer membrane receptor